MTGDVLASVIIISYNGRRYLENSVRAVLDQSLPSALYEVIVVDNASTDGSADFVEKSFPEVRVVRLPKNLGFYGAENYCIDLARGKYMVELPQDTVVHKRWLEEMVNVAEKDESVAGCLASTINPPDPDFKTQDRESQPQYVYIGRCSAFGNYWVERIPREKATEPIRLLIAAGVSKLIRKSFLQENPFDLFFFHYASDIDFGVRVNLMGYKLVLVPTAAVYHIDDGKSAFNRKLLERYFLGLRDRLILYYKDMTILEYLLSLPLLYFGLAQKALDLRIGYVKRIILFIAMFFVSPVILAAALINLPRVRAERHKVQSRRKVGQFWLLKCLLGKTEVR